MVDRTGDLLQRPGLFSDYPTPIVREGAEGWELYCSSVDAISARAEVTASV